MTYIHICGKALVRIRAKIEKITLYFGRTLFRIRANIEKNTLHGWDLVRIRAKIEKNTLYIYINTLQMHLNIY